MEKMERIKEGNYKVKIGSIIRYKCYIFNDGRYHALGENLFEGFCEASPWAFGSAIVSPEAVEKYPNKFKDFRKIRFQLLA